MAAVFRAVGSIVIGMVVAFVLVVAVEAFGNVAHPFPPDFGGTHEEMCKHVARFPHWVLAVAVAAWGATAFVSTWVTQRLGGRDGGTLVGLYLVAAVASNVSMLPYTMWFKVVILLVIPAAVVLALRRSGRGERVTATAADSA